MDWIKEILSRHTDENGVVKMEEAMKEINATFSKHAIPKNQYDKVSQRLKEAEKTLDDLKESTKDQPELQAKLQEAEQARIKAEVELKQLEIRVKASESLRAQNVVDIDYALFKIGELEVDEKGEIKDLDTKISAFKEANPQHIKQETPKTTTQPTFFGASPATLAKTDPPSGMSKAAQLAQEANESKRATVVDPWGNNN